MSKITRLKNDIITFLETYSSFEIDEEWEVNLSNFEELLEEAESILIDLGESWSIHRYRERLQKLMELCSNTK